jgi:hypothetical protein
VYDDISSVPPWYFDGDDFIVEKFLPEFENGLYYV